MVEDANKKITQIEDKLDDLIRNNQKSTIEMSKDIEYIKKEIVEIKSLVGNHYVSRIEFEPIKKIVFGIVGLVLAGAVTSFLALILKN